MRRGILAVMNDGPIQTVEDYVRVEDESSLKHEFYDGQIRAMGGGTPRHARLGASLMIHLGIQLAGRRCTLYSSDLRVRVVATGLITYPDLSVACEEPKMDAEDHLAQLNPTVLVEVTSKSTEKYDRTTKYEHYKLIPKLREYVIVSHREQSIEVYRRADDGAWARAERGGDGDVVTLTSIGCTIDVSAVYRLPGSLSS
jgi:Uma2 family endonuclease